MKKYLLILTLLISININSQSFKTGVSIGFTQLYSSSEINNNTIKSIDKTGYLAIFTEIKLSDQLNLLQQFQYQTEFKNLIIPVQLEFKTKIVNFLIGPQLNIVTDKLPDDFTNVTLSAIAGISYNIDKNLKLLANYSYGITDSYTGNLPNIKTQTNSVNFGILFNFIR